MTRQAPSRFLGPARAILLGGFLAVLGTLMPALAQGPPAALPGGLGGALGEPGSALPKLPELAPGQPPTPEFTLPPLAPPAVEPPAGGGLRVLVQQIRVDGNTVLPPSAIDEITAPFVGRELGSSDLEELRRRLTEAYVARGYITSGAVLPDQRIENGVVIYRVVEGRLTDIEVTGTDWLRPGYVRDRLARAAGPPVNVEAVERRVELLLQDPAIARMNVELVPGAAPGEARLLARVTEKKPYSLVATIANDEPPTVGSVRGELAGVLRSLTGWGDTLALRYGRTAGVNQGGVAWAVPVTAADTTVAVRWDYDGAAVVSETFSGLDIRSTTTTYGVAVSQPVYRTPRQALTLSLGFDSRSNDTTLLGEPFSFSPGFVNGHARASILRFSQEWLDRRADQVLALRSTFSRGLGLLGATHSGQQPDANFTVWLGQAQYVHTVFGDSQIIARTDVQLSRDPLFPFEQIAIGGAGTVRGYRENTLVRDSGVIASLEGRIPVAKLPLPAISTGDNDGTLQLAPFVDYGTGWNKRSPTPRPRDLSSVGVGLRWEVSDRLSMQLYYGYALRHIHVTGRDLQDNGIHFRLVARAF